MFPGYKNQLTGLALNQVSRPVHEPNYHLGVYPFEVLTNVTRLGYTRTMPEVRQNLVSGGVPVGQTYEGVPGWGSIIPEIMVDSSPYYGDEIGGF